MGRAPSLAEIKISALILVVITGLAVVHYDYVTTDPADTNSASHTILKSVGMPAPSQDDTELGVTDTTQPAGEMIEEETASIVREKTEQEKRIEKELSSLVELSDDEGSCERLITKYKELLEGGPDALVTSEEYVVGVQTLMPLLATIRQVASLRQGGEFVDVGSQFSIIQYALYLGHPSHLLAAKVGGGVLQQEEELMEITQECNVPFMSVPRNSEDKTAVQVLSNYDVLFLDAMNPEVSAVDEQDKFTKLLQWCLDKTSKIDAYMIIAVNAGDSVTMRRIERTVAAESVTWKFHQVIDEQLVVLQRHISRTELVDDAADTSAEPVASSGTASDAGVGSTGSGGTSATAGSPPSAVTGSARDGQASV